MRFLSFLFGINKEAAKQPSARPTARSRRLRLETLEGRAMLTTFLVNTIADEPIFFDPFFGTFGVPDGFLSLREALIAANEDIDVGDAPAGQSETVDVINFDTTLNGQIITLQEELPIIDRDIIIQGPGADQLAIDGAGTLQIMSVDGFLGTSFMPKLILTNITLQNANANFGAALINSGKTELNDVVIKDCASVTVNGGTSTGGGAIWNDGDITLNSSTIHNNTAGIYGGGIWNRGVLNVVNSTVSGNTSQRAGGGIFSGTGTSSGGNGPGTLNIVNSTITGNRTVNSVTSGSGISVLSGRSYVYNSILAGNELGLLGNSVGVSDVQGVIFDAKNTIISSATNNGGIPHGTFGNIVGNAGTGTLDVTKVLDPVLKINSGNTPTHALVPGSVAIDAGDNNLALDRRSPQNALQQDQRGKTRIVNGNSDSTTTVDIGAFETQRIMLSKYGGSILYTEKGSATTISSTIQLPTSGVVYGDATITVKFHSNGTADDRLEIRSGSTLTTNVNNQILYAGQVLGTFTGGVGVTPLVITLNTTATAAKSQLVLRSLTFSNVSNFPKNIPRNLTLQMIDGAGGIGNLLSKPANVARVNDATIIAAFGTNVNYTKTGAAVAITSTALLTDIDSSNFNGGSLRIAYTTNPDASGLLAIRNFGNVTTSGSNLLYSGVVIGTFTGGNGNTPLVITFTSNAATPGKVQGVLRNIVYSNSTSAALVRGLRTTLADGDGGTTNIDSTITVL